uniref:Secreted protein n=1 Tax=Achlya hypogyna TaxID=1202772 RepID=A0A0A7CMW9_ACHHY|nr:secreted protein [Achlya hypogyna]
MLRILLLAGAGLLVAAESERVIRRGCTSSSQCPVRACDVGTCQFGLCMYVKKTVGSKCPGMSRNNNGACDDDANDYCDANGECQNAYKVRGAVCRPAADICDVPEVCDGRRSTFAPFFTVCTSIGKSSDGDCDGVDYCDGWGSCRDHFVARDTVCRAAVNVCDVPEVCDGSTGGCPIDKFAPEGTDCTGIGASTGGVCDIPDKCDNKGKCVEGYKPATAVCRGAADLCDVAEYCTGSSGSCPPDIYASAGAVCRPGLNQCDAAETCSGTSILCPVDKLAPSTTVCSGSSSGGACDAIDYCDGFGNCVDHYFGDTTLCSKGLTLCDANYFCDGKQSACPVTTVPVFLAADASTAEYVSHIVCTCALSASTYTSASLASVTTGKSALLLVLIGVVATTAFMVRKAHRDTSSDVIKDGYAEFIEI